MSSRRKVLTMEEVSLIRTLQQAIIVMRQYDIPIPPTEKNINFERAILIIENFVRAGGPAPIVKRTRPLEHDTIKQAVREDSGNRTALRDFYHSVLKFSATLPKPFQNDLEQMFAQYERHFKQYIEDLSSSQCVLLIAGEMGSGKSSLVNLLLGVPLLPTSELRCTAAIVEIQYGATPQAIAYPREDSSGRSRSPLTLRAESTEKSGELIKELEHYITLRDDETDESPFEKIVVSWPIEMLQGGVTIVDSPGVGDNRGLSQALANYMEKAFGFIYVIDSTSAVHKHRLGQLLLKAVEINDGFDHNTTLFICNRWDQVPPGDSERVKESLADRLGMILPGVKKSQLYPISVKQSAMDADYGHVRPEHENLISGLKRFLPQTMRGKLRFYYRYLANFLKRGLHTLRISYNVHKEKDEEMRKNYTSIEGRISSLQKNSKEKLDKMRREVKVCSFEAGGQALDYLNSMRKREKMKRWSETMCPKKEKSWQNVAKAASFAIAERIAEEINQWENENKYINKITKEIIQGFQQQFSLLDNQLHEIQGVLLNGDDMRSFVTDARRDIKKPAKITKSSQTNKNDPVDSFDSFGAAVISCFNLDLKDSKLKKLFKDKYDGNPSKVMEEATEMFLGLLNENSIAAAMGKFFDRFIKGIDRVATMVPHLMKADEMLLNEIGKELESNKEKLKAFPGLSDSCSKILGQLDMFFVRRLMVTDFTADKIVLGEQLGRGSFAVVHKAKLKHSSGEIHVAVKEPLDVLRPSDVTDTLLEDAILREIEHTNIVKYFGVCRQGTEEKMKLLFIMEYCPHTLKARCIDTDNSPSSLGNNPARQKDAIAIMTNYLLQICNGLAYLHQKAIVHRDLKPENVLITSQGEVRIADFGLAKKVKDVVTLCIGTPVYMAPEILLLSDKYDTKADIYGLAMIMWELWYGKDLAKYASMEVQGGLKVAVDQGWRPSLFIVQAPTQFWKEMIEFCWDRNPKQRPSAVQVGRKLMQYFQELQS
ncbi:uncharacterized protein LOC131956913 [Physella acuta]|uniref:uncharacterized protein LOC131956913 n=1 Tax=Physella acuta TaxID=109671 RepID=UPI0027DBCA74|nr:uncharacterized protein LOC131956913 [Physella acuta]